MDRRMFPGSATAAVLAQGLHPVPSFAAGGFRAQKPMELGLLISPSYGAVDEKIRLVHEASDFRTAFSR